MIRTVLILLLALTTPHVYADDFTYIAGKTEHFAFTSSNTYIRNTFKSDGSVRNLGLDEFRLVSDNRLYLGHAYGPVKLTAMLPAFLYNGRYERYLRADAYGIGDLRTGVLYTDERLGTAGLTFLLPTSDRSKGLGTNAFGMALSGIFDGLGHALFTLDTEAYLKDNTGLRRGIKTGLAGYYKWFAWTGLYAVWQDAGDGPGASPSNWRMGFKVLQNGQGRGPGSVIYTLWSDLAGRNTTKGYGFTLGLLY